MQAAEEIVIAIRAVGKPLLYADCNAIAPQKVIQTAQIMKTRAVSLWMRQLLGRLRVFQIVLASMRLEHRLTDLRSYRTMAWIFALLAIEWVKRLG